MGALLRRHAEIPCSRRIVLHFYVWVVHTATLLVSWVSAFYVLSLILFDQGLALKQLRFFSIFVGSGHGPIFVYKIVLRVLVRGGRWSLPLHAHTVIASIGQVNCARCTSTLGQNLMFEVIRELTQRRLLISWVYACWVFVSDLRLNCFVKELGKILLFRCRFWWLSVVSTLRKARDNDTFQKPSVFRLGLSEKSFQTSEVFWKFFVFI